MPSPLLQILLAIALVLAANHYWRPQTALNPDPGTSDRQRDLPRTYVDKPRAWTFDERGDLTDILTAERLEQYPQRNFSAITRPRFYAHSRDDKTWSAEAERGRFEHLNERLLLRKKVVLVHDQTGTRVDTHALDIELDSRVARSNRKVTITQGENQTTAAGMIARLDEETLSLRPDVESIYVPQP